MEFNTPKPNNNGINSYVFLPTIKEEYELKLAELEIKNFGIEQLILRSAYLQSVNGINTFHYDLCASTNILTDFVKNSTQQKYYQDNLFSVGYGTHGLFPYRGKFHPQMIKGIFNALKIKKTDVILDPMCGSGTTNIEASLLGINSYASDISPFCQLMTEVKYNALLIKPDQITDLEQKSDLLFDLFSSTSYPSCLQFADSDAKLRILKLCLLAFLDSIGYHTRNPLRPQKELFGVILRKYVKKLTPFLKFQTLKNTTFGVISVLTDSSAMDLKLSDNQIDCIITSPPYSDMIDYVDNDAPIHRYMGTEITKLKANTLGLKGKDESEKIDNYLDSISKILNEGTRVLKLNKYFVMIIGYNKRQNQKYNLKNRVYAVIASSNLQLVSKLEKPLKGYKNEMKLEEILFLKKIKY